MSSANLLTNMDLSKPSMTVLERLKTFWATRSSKQRLYLAVGLAGTVAVLAGLTQMITTPEYKPLISGLEASDVQAISAQLSAKKIPFQLGPEGTSITVPVDNIDAARLEISSHDSSHSGRMGFEIFDKVSWGETEFDEKVNYQRALEGELERTIQTMSNIKSARVHLVMAKDSVFMDRERSAKASVTVRLRRGSLSRDELDSITRLVAGAVDELKPTDVAIIDSDTNQTMISTSNVSGFNKTEEQALTQRLVDTLSPIVGPDRIHATVNLEYETGSSEESQEKYDPTVSTPLNMQRTEETVSGNGAIGGVPGTSSNVLLAKPMKPGEQVSTSASPIRDPGQSSKTESATYGVNRTTRHVIEPAGNIKRLTAAVLVDDVLDRRQEKGKWIEATHKRSPEDLKLQSLSFSRLPTQDEPVVSFAEKTREGLRDYSSAARYGSMIALFGLVYALMIRPIQKRALATPDNSLVLGSAQTNKEFVGNSLLDTPSLMSEKTSQLKKQLSEFVQSEPESSAVAVRAWLREDAQ
jgi:flagellar M-ring protein FliF